MNEILKQIRKPIEQELQDFGVLFDAALSNTDGTLSMVLNEVRKRSGKRMRPMLTILIAKNFGCVTDVTLHAAAGLELLHTASLIHDDVVDESDERRGQPSSNSVFGNKVAVLAGDFITSQALISVAKTGKIGMVKSIADLGCKLSNGEIKQLSVIGQNNITEEDYYDVIDQKTAALFETCCRLGALSVNATEDDVKAAQDFGHYIGTIFQIRDDIFDYYDSAEIGKPTGNDMREGKLTLPVIHVLLSNNDEEMRSIAMRVKKLVVTPEEIARLVAYTKEHGGIEYAWQKMESIGAEARKFIATYVKDPELKPAFEAYLNYVIMRTL